MRLAGRASCWAGLAWQKAGEGEEETGYGWGSPRLFWKVRGGVAGAPEETRAPAQGVKAPDLPPLRRAHSGCPPPSIKWVQHQTGSLEMGPLHHPHS